MFCSQCGQQNTEGVSFCSNCGNQLSSPMGSPSSPSRMHARPTPLPQGDVSPKSRLAVTLLAWFLGGFGIHRFYLEKIGTGILMLLTFGGLGIWALIDFIMAVCGVMKDKDGKPIVNW